MIMSNLSTGKIDPKTNPSGTGSYLSEMLFIALNRNLPEQVEAATEHALGITKIGKSKIIGTPAVRATPVWSPPRDIFKNSGGHVRPGDTRMMKSSALSKSVGKRNASQVAAAPGAAPEMEAATERWELDQLITLWLNLWPTIANHPKESIWLLARPASADMRYRSTVLARRRTLLITRLEVCRFSI